jgi:glyoxalase family protein
MDPTLPGIHHVTAIAGDPQRNLDFYTGVLGLRLVKLTVNFDDPGTYHFYFGDREGHPGTIMTFFPWPGAPRGRHGSGQLTVTSFSIPQDSLDSWLARLREHGIEAGPAFGRFDDDVLPFADPDGLKLELIAHGEASGGDHSIRGFHSVTLSEDGYERTAQLLTGVMGFRHFGSEGNRHRFAAAGEGPASLVDIECVPDARPGRVAVGTVHHVAFRAPNSAQQLAWRDKVAGFGLNVTPVLDRQYFRSIYFREPGGVLFEIATDPPGFAIDEPDGKLGASLKLPPQYERARRQLEEQLPKLRLPEAP